jgi:hypothetical protein
MAPYGSEFSRGVWISIFIFYFLALSLRNFTVFYRIVLMYVYVILLRNTASRSNWKRVAGVITQWFWCKYFAHSFILHSECSKKNYRLPILDYNMAAYPHRVPGAVCLCLGGRKESVTTPHCDSGSARNILSHACFHSARGFALVAVQARRRINPIVTKCDKRDEIPSFLPSTGILHRQFDVNMQPCCSLV